MDSTLKILRACRSQVRLFPLLPPWRALSLARPSSARPACCCSPRLLLPSSSMGSLPSFSPLFFCVFGWLATLLLACSDGEQILTMVATLENFSSASIHLEFCDAPRAGEVFHLLCAPLSSLTLSAFLHFHAVYFGELKRDGREKSGALHSRRLLCVRSPRSATDT